MISSSRDPSDLIITFSSSDEKEMSSQGRDYDEGHYPDDNNEGHYPDNDEGHYSDEMERINTITRLVFPCLPARTLLRFKSVSPNFNNLISSPFMVHSHFLHPKALSGVFYHQPARSDQIIPRKICYLSFDAPSTNLPDPSLSYLPEPVTIMASTRGLLCVRGLNTSKLYVINPTTKEWVELPAQPTLDNVKIHEVAVVIVFYEPLVYNFSGDYWVVCAYPIIEGVYSFITFSSDNWAWTESDKMCDVVNNIVAASGTAVGAVAYWHTNLYFILSYDPVKDRVNTMQRPHCELEEIGWELGEMNGQLSVTLQSNLRWVLVSTMTSANNGENPSWNERADFWPHGADVLPIRSQGLPNLIFWEVNGNAKGLVLRDMEGQQVCNFEEPTENYGFTPYISTLVPVSRPGAGTGTEPSVNEDA